MTHKKKAAGEVAASPATIAPASQPVPVSHTPAVPEWPHLGLAVAIVSSRYGLSLPWAAIVAAAAGLGGCAQ